MIGDSTYYYPEVKSLIIPGFTYLGHLPLEETMKWFSRAKIFVCTSTIEGMPNVFLQAWNALTLVVSVHVNPDELLTRRQMGLFLNGNEQALSGAIVQATQNFDTLTDFTANARTKAIEEFDIEQNIQRMETLFLTGQA
jgi:glycosyltransferase involved in cell wall biosynthesis